ncbi:MAG: hypothetical protein SFV15_13510 [Polyangiaceae bacterium]|nr:hypothetical protein [Polyangiaceae bacterium]
MTALFRRFSATSRALLAVFLAAPAHAQHCAPELTEAPPLKATFALAAASYRTPRYEGRWEGARVGLAGSWAPLSGRVWVPAYRLERNGLTSTGLGDVGVGASATFWGGELRAYGGGLDVAITLPTGAPDKDLGMGHPMVMSGPFGSLRLGRFSLGAELTFATVLSSEHAGTPAGHDHGAHTHGPSPIVAPMNGSEAEASALVRFAISPHWRAEASATGATPLAAHGGEARLFGGVGPGLSMGPLDLLLRVELPFYGDAFLVRTSLAAGWAFGA